MSKCRSKKKLGLGFLGIFMLVMAFCIPAAAGVAEEDGKYEVYPTPQEYTNETGTTVLTDQVDVTYGESIDSYTQKRVEDTLAVLDLEKSAAPSNDHTKLIVGVYGEDTAYDAQLGAQDFFTGAVAGLTSTERFDKHILWISNGTIVILGENTDAAFYGVTTLKHIFEQLNGKEVNNLTIKDYAEIKYRGALEGYYGSPWSVEDRIDMMKFGGEIKMNQYGFAPKDDPYHNSKWRELYPDAELEDMRAMAQAGNESKCYFVYMLHPFMSNPVRFNTEENYNADLQLIKDKFTQLMGVGMRKFGILADDSGGASGANLRRMMNDMVAWLHTMQASYPDLDTSIVFCPQDYMYTDTSMLREFCDGLSDEVLVAMTGGKIWGEVSNDFMDGFYNAQGCYPYMWVNWPCNDNTKTSAIMGGHNYILHTGLDGRKCKGIILNSIQESETSKVGVFTGMDYAWNIWQTEEEGDQAWEDSFKYINHMTPIETEESNALREVAQHMITQSPDQTVPGKQVQFDESLNIKDQIIEFRTKLDEDTLQITDVDALRNELKVINDAANLYLDPDRNTNKRTVAQMTPFLSCLRDMTKADLYLLDAVKASIQDDKNMVSSAYLEAQTLYEKSKTYGFSYYGAGIIYAQAARKYITPLTDALMERVSNDVKNMVNPEYEEPEFGEEKITSSYGNKIKEGSYQNLRDKKDSTYIWFEQNISAGDWLQYDVGGIYPVNNVRIVVGSTKEGKGTDKWSQYHLEYSENGTDWNRTESYTGTNDGTDIYTVDLEGVSARYIRLVNDTAKQKWAMFSEFTVDFDNGRPAYTNKENTGWKVDFGVDTFTLRPISNVSLAKDDYVGIKLDRIHDINSITVQGTGVDDLVLEKSVNAKEWKSKDEEGAARYIRLINKSSGSVTVSIESLIVKTNEILPMDLYEKTLPGNVDTNSAYWMDGNLSTAAKYGSGPSKAGQYITYDLGQKITLRSLKIYVLDTDYDYPRDAIIQASMDNENWTDVLTIGDGVEDSADVASTKPAENGWTHDTVDVAYSYMENPNIPNVDARYLRMYFTAPYTHRWVKVNEIRINGGEFIPSVNDPTFETDVKQKKGYEISNLTDGDLTSAFIPDGNETGSLIYNISEDKKFNRINILQNGNMISHAVVSVRTGENTWEEIGTLEDSYSAFYVGDLDNIYAVKIEWKNVIPTIYEIITLQESGADMADFLEKNIEKAKAELDSVKAELEKAKDELAKVQEEVKKAQDKVNAAPNEVEKLKAEIELQNLYAKQSAAEAVVAEREATQLDAAAAVSQATVRKLMAMIAAASDEDKTELENQLKEEKQAVTDNQTQAANKRTEAVNKKEEQKNYQQEAAKKTAELKNAEKKQNITTFTVGSLNYKVTDASAKTVTVTGPTDKKKVKTVNIAATVSYGGITWNVTEISANAFKGCKNLKKVTIGSNVTKIGNSAFASCKKLKTINMKKAAKITSFGKKSFKGINSKAKITVGKKQLKTYKKKLKKTGLPKTASIK